MKRTRYARILAALLALVLMLSGCGAPPAEDISPAATDMAATDAPATDAPETDPPATEAEGKDLSLGRIEGSTYINEYIGFTVTFGEGWTFKSAEELQELPENIAELLEGTEVGESMGELTQIMDMQAENAETLTSINVIYQNLGLQERLVYLTMNEEEILDAMLGQSAMLIEGYEQMGLTVESLDKVTVNFLGQERLALKTVCDMSGVKYYTLQVFDYHLGKYGTIITFSCFIEDTTADLAAMCQIME